MSLKTSTHAQDVCLLSYPDLQAPTLISELDSPSMQPAMLLCRLTQVSYEVLQLSKRWLLASLKELCSRSILI